MTKIRPQILIAVVILGILALAGLHYGVTEVTVGAITVIAAVAKSLIDLDGN